MLQLKFCYLSQNNRRLSSKVSLVLPFKFTNLGITLAALAEESWTQAPVEAPSQPFGGWMTKSEDLEYLTSTYTDCRHK